MRMIISLYNVFETGAHEYEQGSKRKCAHKCKDLHKNARNEG